MKVIQTDGKNKDFYNLCTMLDKSLNDNAPGRKDAGMNSLYGIEKIENVFLLYDGDEIIGSAALFQHDTEECELIRVFICDNHRGKGLCEKVIKKVEDLAIKKGYDHIFLRTYSSTPYAVRAYEKLGYTTCAAADIKFPDKFPNTHPVAKLRVFMGKILK